MSILEVKNLSKTFKTSQGNDFVALSDVNLSIEQGEIFGVIGLSGAGKSTLVRCMNLLEKPPFQWGRRLAILFSTFILRKHYQASCLASLLPRQPFLDIRQWRALLGVGD